MPVAGEARRPHYARDLFLAECETSGFPFSFLGRRNRNGFPRRSERGVQWRQLMDEFFVVVTLAFFVVCAWYTRSCDKLVIREKED